MRRREQGAALAHNAYAGHQLVVGNVFDEESAGTCAQRGVHIFVEIECGEHDDPRRVAGVGEDLLGGRDTVDSGHPDVHEHDIRAEFSGQPDGLVAVTGLPDDIEVGFRLEDRAQAGENQ